MLKLTVATPAIPHLALRDELGEDVTHTPEDVVERLTFAKTIVSKSVGWWKSPMHMIIDVKYFRVVAHGSVRRYATRKVTRGTSCK